jgi:hypothetical protein
MRLMLVAGSDEVREQLRDKWSAAGHDVVMCVDDDRTGPCRGVREPSRCPLRQPVDLAVLVSRSAVPTELAEMGAVCARRHRVPMVTIDPVLAADELWHVETETSAAMHQLQADDARAVRERLPYPAEVVVFRQPTRLAVEVRCSTADQTGAPVRLDAKQRLAIADLARAAIREHDPYVPVIDVNVVDADVTDDVTDARAQDDSSEEHP